MIGRANSIVAIEAVRFNRNSPENDNSASSNVAQHSGRVEPVFMKRCGSDFVCHHFAARIEL
jgi:hypothetical protein